MTSALKRYCRQLPQTQALARMQLPECLRSLGLNIAGRGKLRGHGINVRLLDEWGLADLFKLAHAKFRNMMQLLHPDAGGSHEFCSRLTELWVRIKILFRKKGIEV